MRSDPDIDDRSKQLNTLLPSDLIKCSRVVGAPSRGNADHGPDPLLAMRFFEKRRAPIAEAQPEGAG